jgi:ABC-2 type transport system ATP-binding protein
MDAARLEGVVVSYGPGTRALDGLDLRVRDGAITALLGPNGAGKSSAVGVLAGLVRPMSGRAQVLGGTPGRPAARQRVNVMVQDDGLPTGARGAEVVRHVARLRGAPESAEPLISLLGLDQLGRTSVRRLSGGERRRVSLACALVGDRGRAVLLCTHLLDEAEALADDVAIIASGQVRAGGPLASLVPTGTEVVTFDGPLHLDVRSLVDALPEGAVVTEISPGRYRIEGGASPQILATVASWCAQHGVQPRNLGVGSESLADAYWRLTDDTGSAT